VDAGVAITDNEQQEEEAQQALNLMKKSDEALEELISYYKEVKEPTVIILFGDHQPRVGNSFYKAVKKGSSELKYKVPFLIWANYDIKEKQNVEISANYLSAYALDEIGLSQTGYSKFLLNLRNEFPVITGNCFIDKYGKMYMANKKNDIKELNDYSIVQYNGLVKKADKKRGFFRLK
jgi:glucan phosphoethanolaminetransferase (alkaline phosphatase superfamily)